MWRRLLSFVYFFYTLISICKVDLTHKISRAARIMDVSDEDWDAQTTGRTGTIQKRICFPHRTQPSGEFRCINRNSVCMLYGGLVSQWKRCRGVFSLENKVGTHPNECKSKWPSGLIWDIKLFIKLLARKLKSVFPWMPDVWKSVH